MARSTEWRGTADLLSDDGQVVVALRVVLYYQASVIVAYRWWIGSAIVIGGAASKLPTRVGTAFTLRLVDGHETRVCLRAVNPLDPRHPRLEPIGDQPLFPR
jgi:hypothetical protein